MDDRAPLVSVIIPTYNSALFVGRCLDSVLNQSFRDFEVIIVDDMSGDNTLDVLSSYASKHAIVSVIEAKEKGLAGGARNLGVKRAAGRYISFIDSDDWIDTNFLHYMVQAIEQSSACLSVSGVKREYSNAKCSRVRYSYGVENTVDGKFALTLLSRAIDQDVSISAIVCNKLFRADFLRQHDLVFIENCYNEDDVFMFEVFLKAERVRLTDKAYYHVSQRSGSASRNFGRKHIDDLFFAFSTIRQRLVAIDQFSTFKTEYYGFFEKCLGYLFESIRVSRQNDEALKEYLKYAFSICQSAVAVDEFIEYCGSARIEEFFTLR